MSQDYLADVPCVLVDASWGHGEHQAHIIINTVKGPGHACLRNTYSSGSILPATGKTLEETRRAEVKFYVRVKALLGEHVPHVTCMGGPVSGPCLRQGARLRGWGSCEHLAQTHATKSSISNLSPAFCSCHCMTRR